MTLEKATDIARTKEIFQARLRTRKSKHKQGQDKETKKTHLKRSFEKIVADVVINMTKTNAQLIEKKCSKCHKLNQFTR